MDRVGFSEGGWGWKEEIELVRCQVKVGEKGWVCVCVETSNKKLYANYIILYYINYIILYAKDGSSELVTRVTVSMKIKNNFFSILN